MSTRPIASRPIRDAVLSKTGPGTWTSFGGAYTVARSVREDCGEVTYEVTTMRFQREGARPRHAVCETLAGVRDAITAWEASGGSCWHLHLVTGSGRPGPR